MMTVLAIPLVWYISGIQNPVMNEVASAEQMSRLLKLPIASLSDTNRSLWKATPRQIVTTTPHMAVMKSTGLVVSSPSWKVLSKRSRSMLTMSSENGSWSLNTMRNANATTVTTAITTIILSRRYAAKLCNSTGDL